MMFRNRIFLLSGLYLILNGSAFQAQTTLPLNLSPEKVKPLRTLIDKGLEKRLSDELYLHPDWQKLVKEKKLAVGLVDLRNPYKPLFASVNGNEMMYAASMPKIAILLTAMDAIEHCELEQSEEITKDLNDMICHSSNQASTRMIDRLGYKKIEEVLTDPRYEFYDEEEGGGLWVGKRYAASGARHPDPLRGLSHAATVSQVCRFYYQLAMGRLVSRERSRQMLEIMDDPALHHKFVNTLDKIAPKADLYRKSGTWKTFHSDSILVWDKDPQRRYILVAMANCPDGEQVIRELVNSAERALQLRS